MGEKIANFMDKHDSKINKAMEVIVIVAAAVVTCLYMGTIFHMLIKATFK